ncbi:MAG: NAD-dependent deacylase [Phycisphaerae bacterium]|jgi:NAD-dependent deacetylase
MNPIDQIARYIDDANAGVAFTGAGISTESGIPDFRSPGGVWSKQSPVYYDEFVASREARARYWAMRVQMHREFDQAEPNDGHRALARFEELGKLIAVITQNIDGLHQDAGSRHVVELHGTARVVGCIGCGKEWEPHQVLARVEAGDTAPDCDECGAPLKSKTVSFGQSMPVREMAEASRLVQAADLCLAIGSSLVVEPAASIPRLAKQYGATLVIINRTETPLDFDADLVIREPIGETMRAVLERFATSA